MTIPKRPARVFVFSKIRVSETGDGFKYVALEDYDALQKERDELEYKLEYFERHLCYSDKFIDRPDAQQKAISTMKVTEVIKERDTLKRELEQAKQEEKEMMTRFNEFVAKEVKDTCAHKLKVIDALKAENEKLREEITGWKATSQRLSDARDAWMKTGDSRQEEITRLRERIKELEKNG